MLQQHSGVFSQLELVALLSAARPTLARYELVATCRDLRHSASSTASVNFLSGQYRYAAFFRPDTNLLSLHLGSGTQFSTWVGAADA